MTVDQLVKYRARLPVDREDRSVPLVTPNSNEPPLGVQLERVVVPVVGEEACAAADDNEVQVVGKLLSKIDIERQNAQEEAQRGEPGKAAGLAWLGSAWLGLACCNFPTYLHKPT